MLIKRVDTHPHIVSPDTTKYPLAPLGGKRSDWSAEKHSNTVGELIAAMDDAGVAKAAVVHSSTTYGYDNSLVLDAVASYPDRLTAVCSIDVLAPDAVDVLKDILNRGCSGIRFFTTGTTMPGQADWLNDPRSYPVWEHAQKVNLPICVQANPAGMTMLREMMDRYPAVTVVLDHAGRADVSDGPPFKEAQTIFDLAPAYPQLVVKFTPAVIGRARQGKSTPETFVPMLVEAFGPERMMWGSNFPSSPGGLAAIAEESETVLAFLPKAKVEQIMSGTAQRLYPTLAD